MTVDGGMLDLVLRTAGPCFFMGMQVASLTTALRIHSSRSTGVLSVLPFVSLMTNSILWALYGALRGDYTLMVPNVTGSVVGLGCVYVYHLHCPRETYENEARYYYLGSTAIICFSLLCSYNHFVELIGTLGIVMCVVLMGSPLAVLSTVLTEKNCDAMPFWTSLATWCNTLSWAMYGLLIAKDVLIYLPNFVGFTLASVQMLLFATFGIPVSDRFWVTNDPAKLVTGRAVIAPILRGPVVPVRTVYAPLNNGQKATTSYTTPDIKICSTTA